MVFLHTVVDQSDFGREITFHSENFLFFPRDIGCLNSKTATVLLQSCKSGSLRGNWQVKTSLAELSLLQLENVEMLCSRETKIAMTRKKCGGVSKLWEERGKTVNMLCD